MSRRATTLRLSAGAAFAAVVGAGVLSSAFAADVATGCAFTDPAGDAEVPTIDLEPDGDIDIVSVAVAGDATGLTVVMKVVALQEYGTNILFGDRHEVTFTAAGKAVVLGASRYVDDPLANTYAPSPYGSIGGTDVGASYKTVYDVKASTITYSLSAADLKTGLGSGPAGVTLSGLAASAHAKTTPLDDTDLPSDDAAAPTATSAYVYGGRGCSAPPAPAPSATATAAPTASGSAAPSASAEPTASSSATATSTATSSATAAPTSSSEARTAVIMSGAVRVQHTDSFTTLVTLKNSSGEALAGKRVTAKHGSSATQAKTTNDLGQARFTFPARDRAGTRNLVVSFAGDGQNPARTAQRAITTVNEVTKLQKSVTGSGDTRTVVVRLLEDDSTTRVLAGRGIVFQFSGRTVTVKTDSTGRARMTARTGAAMDITFTGQTGFYNPAKMRTYAR